MTNCDPIPTVDPGEPAKSTNLSGGGGGAAACTDFEVVCFDSGPTPLLLRTVTDCDPGSPTFGQLLASDYRDPGNPATVVVPTGTPIACPQSVADTIQFETLCEPPPGLAQFLRVYQLDAAGNVTGSNDFDLDGNPIATVAGALDCIGDADTVEHILLDDNGVPFIRRITLLGANVLSVADFELDGTTSFAAATPVGPPDAEYLLLCDQQANGTAVEFMRRLGANGAILADTLLDGLTPYVITGTVIADCAARQVIQVALCEYDAANQIQLGEFLRTWVYDGNGIVLVGPIDTDLDGTTPYVVGASSVTRQCENVVDCDNDPCVSGLDRTEPPDAATPVPTVFNGSGFASFQFDAPPTAVGSPVYKVDIFDGAGACDLVVDPTNAFRSGRLMQWLTSGPGGNRPPTDEIFVVRDVVGGPGGAPVNLAPATAFFQANPTPLVIPGWAVEPEGTGWFNFANNRPFLNLVVDLTIQNPQRCDLTTIELDPVNFPGLTIQQALDAWSAVIDDHFLNAVDPNLAFEVGLAGSGDVDIYSFNAGNPVQSDSVVLCQTVLDNIVCFTGEAEPLQSITALNPTGQVVFGPLFRDLDTGAFITPTGDPTDCTAQALETYRDQCGTCQSAQTGAVFNGTGQGAGFQMGQTNREPGEIIIRLVDGTAAIADNLCAWYNTPGNERSVFVVPSVNGGVWAGRPLVIPHWNVIDLDCSVAGQAGLRMFPDPENRHPDGCDITADANLSFPWAQFVAAQTQQFNVTGHPLVGFTDNSPAGNATLFNLATTGGPALRVTDCSPAQTNSIPMCDVLADGSTVDFRRSIVVDSDGVVTIEDRLIDGTPYTPTGVAQVAGDSLCRFESPEPCRVGEECTATITDGGTHGFPNDPGNGWTFTGGGAGNLTGVNLLSIDNTAWVDALMACVWDDVAGAPTGNHALVSQFSGAFGLTGLFLGGPGLANVVQNAPGDWTFDMDMPGSFAALGTNCPVQLTLPVSLDGGTVTQTVADWTNQFIGQFVLAGFGNTMNTTTQFACLEETTAPIERSALVVRPCQEVRYQDSCSYTDLLNVTPANVANTPFTVQDANYNGAGDSALALTFDLTNEPAWLAALQTWINDGIEPGDIVVINGTWVQNPGGGVVSATGGSTIVLPEDWFTNTPVVSGNTVTFFLDVARGLPCRQGVVTISGVQQPSDFDQGAREWLQDLSAEFLSNPGFLPGPFEVQADNGPLFVFRADQHIDAQVVGICGTVQVDHVNTDALPGIFEIAPTGTNQAFNLDALAASAYTIEVVSGTVTLGPQGGTVVQLTPGNSYSFGIESARGKLTTGPGGIGTGFFLDVADGARAIVTWTRTL